MSPRILTFYAQFTLGTLALTSLSSCGKVFLQATTGEDTSASSFKQDANSAFNNMKERCGGNSDEMSDTDNPFLVLNLKSFALTSKGKDNGIEYAVDLEATSYVESKGAASFNETDVKIVKITAESGGEAVTDAAINQFIRPKAERTIRKSIGQSSGTSVPVTTLQKMHKGEQSYRAYKDMFCSVSFSLGQTDDLGGQKSSLSFSNPLPVALNPKAALDTYVSELGDGKTITSEVTIKTAKDDWLPAGTKIPVTVTIKKVSTDISKLSGLPTGTKVPAITATVAYEFVTTGPKDTLTSKFGLTKRSVYYVNTETKSFAAIVNESDRVENGVTQPPVIMQPQKSSGTTK